MLEYEGVGTGDTKSVGFLSDSISRCRFEGQSCTPASVQIDESSLALVRARK